MKRRDFLLGTGAAGLAALSLRGGRSAQATAPALRPPRRLLVVFVAGGWDTCYAIDPKEPPLVDVPAGSVQQFAGLDVFTDPSRPNVTGFFERHAASTAIVRGIATDGIFHNECQRRIATGKRDDGQPDLAAMVGHDLGNDLPIPYLVLGDIAFTGPYTVSAARVGATNQIVALLGDPAADPAADPVAATEDALLHRYAQASADRARATRGALGYNRRRVDDFAAAIARGDRLRQLRGQLGTRGELQSFTSQIQLALDAVAQDVAHAVMLHTRLFWDTHADNFQQASSHENTFGPLTTLVDQLVTRPGRAAGSKMIDDTVVAVISELGRTPLLGGDPPHQGKGHWPLTSALVIGAGVRGGQAFGATTSGAAGMLIDLATGQPSAAGIQPMYSHFIAGLLALCGADPAAHLGTTPVFDAFLA
ncbi:MAG: DUF1501 domain-containing protein [Deltaproteobacteria bacterium]|nr:MAG: DUF1501 domain-containing protein [Deltaproteobacteria bacterium]TMQ14594.1 MAG: DUF1501 domain-containing protein [Deltaproteobacteria bacterium]